MFMTSTTTGIRVYARYETPSDPNGNLVAVIEQCTGIGVSDGRVGEYDVAEFKEIVIARADVEHDVYDDSISWVKEAFRAIDASTVMTFVAFQALVNQLKAAMRIAQ